MQIDKEPGHQVRVGYQISLRLRPFQQLITSSVVYVNLTSDRFSVTRIDRGILFYSCSVLELVSQT